MNPFDALENEEVMAKMPMAEALLSGFNTMMAEMFFRYYCKRQDNPEAAARLILAQWKKTTVQPILDHAKNDICGDEVCEAVNSIVKELTDHLMSSFK